MGQARRMSFDDQTVTFTQPTRQIFLMILVLALIGAAGTVLAVEIKTVFFANPYLNGFIGGVFVLGVFATFWQVGQLISATRYLRDMQAGLKGHEFSKPPRLVASMAPMMREGRMKKRLAASSTRSILDSIAQRLDEARDITRYISNLLIFLGLLGTFWGLSNTVPAVVDTIRSLAPGTGGDAADDGTVFARLMTGLESQLGGMGTAFASSLMGLAGSLVVGLLELFAGHGQNRFYRELEEWLTSFTRLGLVSEGEGPDGALVALLERVDEGLERTTEFAEKANAARMESESKVSAVADIVAQMAEQVEQERHQVSRLVVAIKESREVEASRDHAILTVLKRMEQSSEQTVAGLRYIADSIETSQSQTASGMDGEVRQSLRNMDKQLRLLADDIAVGRHEATAAVRAELRALINLIDARTRVDGAG